jgi:predicted class III extradiol MEMO1 family dioxygenase
LVQVNIPWLTYYLINKVIIIPLVQHAQDNIYSSLTLIIFQVQIGLNKHCQAVIIAVDIWDWYLEEQNHSSLHSHGLMEIAQSLW